MCQRVPAPSAIFVGRDESLRRVEQALTRVPVAVICGVPGIGKSTLAFSIAARWGRPTIYGRIADGDSLASLVDDARRAAARCSIPEIDDDDERMADLAERLDDTQTLLIIDDLHRLSPLHQLRLILGVGQHLHRGRLLVTTRERPELGTEIDRLELCLAGLDEDSARALWAALDECYQPSSGFDVAWRRSQGNPMLLRQAHRGRPAVNPYTTAIAALSPDERRVASLLALGDVPLSLVGLRRLLPDGGTCAAVRSLHAQLIVDIYPNDTCGLNDLFRDEMQRSLSAAERARCHADLARLLQHEELDVVTWVREVCRHLGELDHFEDAAQILTEHAAELIRRGAARELVCSLEAIPKHRRTTLVEIAHARATGRLLDLRAAYIALEQLLDSGVEPRLDVLLGFGPVAVLTGRLAAAERAFTEALARHDLVSWQRVRAQVAFGLLRTHQGYGDEGRALLRRALAESESREAEGMLLAAEVYSYWLDERDGEAIESLRRAMALFQGSSPTVYGTQLAPAAIALALGRLGRFAEAEPWLRQLAELIARSSDAHANIIYKTVLAHIDYERGERAQALAGLTQVSDELDRVGDPVDSLRARIYVARLLLTMGRRRQALASLDEIATKAHQLGLLGLVHMVERSRLLKPLVQLRASNAPPEPSTKIGVAVRARRMNALRAACDGDGETVAGLLDVEAPLPTGVDYALDRALGHLARSVVARAHGNSEAANTALADARREAQSGDVDLDLLDELEAEFGHLRVVAGNRARLCTSYTSIASSDAIVLDGRSHELRVGPEVHALKRRAMLREILYVLSAQQGYVVSKQEVARHLWSGRYDPTVHDNRLWANIHRLRLFLAPTGLNIEFADDGYRLVPPRDFVFVAPLHRSGAVGDSRQSCAPAMRVLDLDDRRLHAKPADADD